MKGKKKVFLYWGVLALLIISLIKVDTKAASNASQKPVFGYNCRYQDGTLTITGGKFDLSIFLTDEKNPVPFDFCDVRTIVFNESVTNITLWGDHFYSEDYNVEKIVNKSNAKIDLFYFYDFPYNYPKYFWCYENDLKTPVDVMEQGTVVKVNEKLNHLHFDANGGSGTMAQRDYYNTFYDIHDGDVIGVELPRCEFKAPYGKCFGGWKIGDQVHFPETAIGFEGVHDLTASAIWVDPPVLKFDANGGSGKMEVSYGWLQEFDKIGWGYTVKVPECTFTPPYGKTFDHWEIRDTYWDETYDSAENVEQMIWMDTTAVAIWKDLPAGSIIHHLHFNANGGIGTMEQIDFTGDSVTLPYCGFKAPYGKCFGGWKIGSQVYFPEIEIEFKGVYDLTAAAIWVEPPVLKFDANGGSGTMEVSYGWLQEFGKIGWGYTVKVPKCTFTPPYGKTFDHWEIRDTYWNETYDSAEDVEQMIWMDTTAVAIWKDLPAGSIKPEGLNDEKNPVEPPAEEKQETVDTSLKKSKISNAIATKKAVTISWKKQTKGTKGYEIQYSTDKNFTKNVKTITVNKNKTTSKTIKKLKSKTKYYIRIRTFTKKDGKKIYSDWSKTKTVKTK